MYIYTPYVVHVDCIYVYIYTCGCHHLNMEQYIPYSLMRDLLSKNEETHVIPTNRYINIYIYIYMNAITLTWNYHVRSCVICGAKMNKHKQYIYIHMCI